MIINNAQLDGKQFNALTQLLDACKAHDGNIPVLYAYLLVQKRMSDNNVLYFVGNKLIGFLSVYFFYHEACEVSLLVHPAYRKRGLAKQLLKTIYPLLRLKDIKNLIFSVPPSKNTPWFRDNGFSYHHGEYQMQRKSHEPIIRPMSFLMIREASFDDIDALCSIDKACFSNLQGSMPTRFEILLQDKDYTILLGFLDNTPIAKAHIHAQDKSAVLSDIAVLPSYQGRGFGKDMLACCVNSAIKLGKSTLTLDVETTNHHALSLYTQFGFTVSNASDFWMIALDKLSNRLGLK